MESANRFRVTELGISGLKVLERKPLGDHRGHLERLFCSEDLASILDGRVLAQINHSVTVNSGVIRGLHFQTPPVSEMKLVSCVYGEIFDVAVDLRRNSPTFLNWHGEVLSGTNFRTLVIPEGFAHGFQALSDDCHLVYLHTAPFCAAHEGALNALDPRLGIEWPVRISDRSKRDSEQEFLTDAFRGI